MQANPSADSKKIGDILLCAFDVATIEHYTRYLDAHSIILERLEQVLASDAKFQQIFRDFESQKVCYLPLTTLILKPLHRILHYELLLESKEKKLINCHQLMVRGFQHWPPSN